MNVRFGAQVSSLLKSALDLSPTQLGSKDEPSTDQLLTLPGFIRAINDGQVKLDASLETKDDLAGAIRQDMLTIGRLIHQQMSSMPEGSYRSVLITSGLIVGYTAGLGQIEINFIDAMPLDDLDYPELKSDFATRLMEQLISRGLSGADAARIAHATSQESSAAKLKSDKQRDAAIAFAVAAVLADRSRSVQDLEKADDLQLPPKAPEVWAKRDRRNGENAIEFLNRVWGPWIKAGVLYQGSAVTCSTLPSRRSRQTRPQRPN